MQLPICTMMSLIGIRKRTIIGVILAAVFAIGISGSIARTPVAHATGYSPSNYQYRVKDFAIIKRDGVWHAFAIYQCISGYTGCDNTRRGFIHVTSVDLAHWTEVGFVVPPSGSGWDASDVWAPSIVEQNGTYYMFYTGVQNAPDGIPMQRIGYATSTDLNQWTVAAGNPVFSCESLPWAYWHVDPVRSNDWRGDCRDPYVFWDAPTRQWVMTYSARLPDDGTAPPWIWHPMVIGKAVSDDLVSWHDHGFIPETRRWVSESSHVFQHDGQYDLFWTSDRGLEYLTAPSFDGPYTSRGIVAGSSATGKYASEYTRDGSTEYLTSIQYASLTVNSLSWNSGAPDISGDVPFGSVSGTVWLDQNNDGSLGNDETGLRNVTLSLYRDNGDGLFDPDAGDTAYASVQTRKDLPQTTLNDEGMYAFTSVLPGSYWLAVQGTNFLPSGALAGMTAERGPVIAITVAPQQAMTQLLGFVPSGRTWTAGNDMFTVSSGIVQTASAVLSPVFSGTPHWWNTSFKYRRAVAITAGDVALPVGSRVHVGLDIGALRTTGKVLTDDADLRLVYQNGTTATELDFDNASQQFLTHAVIDSHVTDSGYYLYYGSPSEDLHRFPSITGDVAVDVPAGAEEFYYVPSDGSVTPPLASAEPFSHLSSMAANELDQGGSVRYQVSNDGGASWLFWDGSAWSAASDSIDEANTLTIINSNAAAVPTGSGLFLWRAFIHTDADQRPIVYSVSASLDTLPSVPAVISPATGAVVTSLTPTVSFTSVDPENDHVSYEVQFDHDASFTSSALQTVVLANTSAGWNGMDACNGRCFGSGTTASYTPTRFVPNSLVYWRVRAIDIDGSGKYSAYSEPRSMITPRALMASTPTVVPLSTTSALIQWTTSNPGDSDVWYFYEDDMDAHQAESVTSHQVALTGLTPGIAYPFSVTTTDAYGQTITVDGTDFTLPQTATAISNVTVSVTQTSATITWYTNDVADSVVLYGYGSATQQYVLTSVTPVMKHVMTVGRLAANTRYSFILQSTGATRAQSRTLSFMTAGYTAPRSPSGPRALFIFEDDNGIF